MTQPIVAAVIDTYPSRQFLRLATRMVEACPFVSDICIFGTEPLQNHSFVRIDPINSMQDYNLHMLVHLHQHIPDKHVLIFQWDGFPLQPQYWNNDFLKFDYIGAPHHSQEYGCDFFNGGFSLRSPRLNKQVHDVIQRYPRLIHYPEDAVICHLLREKLEAASCEFPEPASAAHFHLSMAKYLKKSLDFTAFLTFHFSFPKKTLRNGFQNLWKRCLTPTSFCTFCFMHTPANNTLC